MRKRKQNVFRGDVVSETEVRKDRGLVYSLNGISTFMGY